MTRPAYLVHSLALLTLGGLACETYTVVSTGKLASWGLGEILFTLVTLAVGWLLAWRRPDVSLGWIMIAIALFGAMRGPTGLLGTALAHSHPLAASWLLWYDGDSQWSWVPEVAILFTQVPLRFPDGRLPSRRWRWFSRATIAAIALSCVAGSLVGRYVGSGVRNPTYLPAVPEDAAGLALIVLLFASFIGSIASLFARYRRADAMERAQLRWVFWSLTLVVSMLILAWTESQIFGDDESGGVSGLVATIWQIVTVAAYFLVPISMLLAVTRHGLYSIDRIISRTAAYAIVTLAVVAVYGGVVLLVGLVLPMLPSIGVAAATLAAAAMFLPALRVVRRAVDRRFNRAQYDAEKVVDAFGERVRTGADPHAAAQDLVSAVERTLRPTALGVWTRGDRT